MIADEDRKELLRVARRAIEAMLKGESFRPTVPGSGELAERRGAFVTLRTKGRLRGCIGRVKAEDPLIQVVSEMAVAAARDDYRFQQLRRDELDQIRIEISALGPLLTIRDVSEVKVGRHGLIIHKGPASGLLLPQVASEQGWDAERFLKETCRKAGLPQEAWREKGVLVEAFEAEVWGEDD